MTALSLADWSRYRTAGAVTFAVGPVTRPVPYLDRAEAEAAADEAGGTYIEWHGCIGHQVATAEFEAEANELEMEAEL